MNFGQVPHWIYRDPKFRSLSPAGQGRYTWLLGHPGRSAVGHLQEWTAGLAQQLGLTHDEFIAELDELRSAELIDYDTKSPTILFPPVHAWKRTPDQLKGWETALEAMWDTELRDRRLLELYDVAQERARESDKPESYLKAIPEQVLAAAQAAAPLDQGQEGAANRLVGRSVDATTESSEPPPTMGEEPASTLKPASSNPEATFMPPSAHPEASMKPASRSTDLRSEIGDRRSERQAADARARKGPGAIPESLVDVVRIALGREPPTEEWRKLRGMVGRWGLELVTQTAERVLVRSVAEDKPAASLGLVLRCLADGDPPSELEEVGAQYRSVLAERLRSLGELQSHPRIEQLWRLVEIAQTGAGLGGIATGVNRWLEARQQEAA